MIKWLGSPSIYDVFHFLSRLSSIRRDITFAVDEAFSKKKETHKMNYIYIPLNLRTRTHQGISPMFNSEVQNTHINYGLLPWVSKTLCRWVSEIAFGHSERRLC